MTRRTHRHELHLTELHTRPVEHGMPAVPAPPRNLRRRGRPDAAADRHAIRAVLHEVERGVDWDDRDAPAHR